LQDDFSLVPVVQMECAHVVAPLEVDEELLLDEELLEPPPQDSPQMEATSLTQMLSHFVTQQ
jgi:hypothetical protein